MDDIISWVVARIHIPPGPGINQLLNWGFSDLIKQSPPLVVSKKVGNPLKCLNLLWSAFIGYACSARFNWSAVNALKDLCGWSAEFHAELWSLVRQFWELYPVHQLVAHVSIGCARRCATAPYWLWVGPGWTQTSCSWMHLTVTNTSCLIHAVFCFTVNYEKFAQDQKSAAKH